MSPSPSELEERPQENQTQAPQNLEQPPSAFQDYFSDPSRRVTQEQIEQSQKAPDSTINELGNNGKLFPYAENGSIMQPAQGADVNGNGLVKQENPANKARNFIDRIRRGRNNQKDVDPKIIEDKKNKVQELIKAKKYKQAINLIKKDQDLRKAMADQLPKIAEQMAKNVAKEQVEKAAKKALWEFIWGTIEFWGPPLAIVIGVVMLVIGIAAVLHKPINNPPNSFPIVGLSDQEVPTVFNPGLIVSDDFLTNSNAMTLNDITTFLKTKNSPLLTYDSVALGDGPNGRNAAQIIFDATRGAHTLKDPDGKKPDRTVQVSINPMMVLAMLQNEQDLINNDHPDQLHKAMSYNCPDGGGTCPANPFYDGFAKQVEYGTARMFEMYSMAKDPKKGYAYTADFRVGNVTSIDNASTAGGAVPGRIRAVGSKFHIEGIRIANAATSMLYEYDDWVYVGNQQLWSIINLWFRSSINTLSGATSQLGNGAALNVPGVSEGDQGDCGGASMNMLFLYYVTNKGANAVAYTDLPQVMQDDLTPVDAANQPQQGQYTTKNQCRISSDNIKAARSGKGGSAIPSDLSWGHISSANQFSAVATSIQNGDPVIVYTVPGGWFAGSQHIYVLDGYDATLNEFLANNPYPGGVNVQVKAESIGKPAQTYPHLFATRGDSDTAGKYFSPAHTLLIRKIYCTTDMKCEQL